MVNNKIHLIENHNNINIIFIITIPLFLVVLISSITFGSVYIPFSATIHIIMQKFFGIGDLKGISESYTVITLMVRLPRVLLSALVGASLSISGAAMQGLLKNPLADGSTLGVASGASLGAVFMIATGFSLPFIPQLGITVISIIFAFLSLLIILTLSYKIDYNLTTNTIILTGVIFSMFVSSVVSLIIALTGEELKQIIFWSMGSFSGRGWDYIYIMLPFFVIGGLGLFYYARELDAFALGEEQAHYIGVDTKKVKLGILIYTSVLIGASVSVSGNIAFVGLVIPHITRMLVGPSHRTLLMFSALIGAIFMMLTDLLSRMVMSPVELPIGIVTSFIGSIIFVYIFYSQRRKK